MAVDSDTHTLSEPETAVRLLVESKEAETGGLTTDKNYWYGCRSFKPRCLQKLNTMKWFVFWASALSFFQGFTMIGLVLTSIPLIEKQFSLPSSKSAIIVSAAEFGAMAVVLFVSFIGDKFNKPNSVACGSLIMAAGSLVMMIPHFGSEATITEENGYNQLGSVGLCQIKPNLTFAKEPEGDSAAGSQSSNMFGVFVLAQGLHGIGSVPLYTLGTTYIDENVEHAVAAMYIGITYTVFTIGMALAGFIGGLITESLYVDFDRVGQSSLHFGPRDPNWIGAWWLGFVPSTVCFFSIAIPIFGFPTSLPESWTVKKEIKADSENDNSTGVTRDFLDKSTPQKEIAGFFRALLKLGLNGEFVFICLGAAINMLVITGVQTFSFKYLLEQYSIQYDVAGYLVGGSLVFCAVGIFFGGVLVGCLRLQSVATERLTAITIVLASLSGLGFLAHCPNVPLSGVEVAYPGESPLESLNLTAACQKSCACDDQYFDPVCGKDGQVYLSSCHAACTSVNSDQSFIRIYGNCSCIAVGLNISSHDPNSIATSGQCDDGCDNIYIMAPFMYLMTVLPFLIITAQSMATLRSVDQDARSFALGVQWILMRLLGSIPGPIFGGFVIDTACLVWSPPSQEDSRSCLMYNKKDLAYSMMIFWIVLTMISAACFLISSFFSSRKKKHQVSSNAKK